MNALLVARRKRVVEEEKEETAGVGVEKEVETLLAEAEERNWGREWWLEVGPRW